MDGPDVTVAFVLQWCFLQRIFDGAKTWEVRGQPCKKRGRVGLASQGQTHGTVEIVGCRRIGRRDSIHDDLRPWGDYKDFVLNNFEKKNTAPFPS